MLKEIFRIPNLPLVSDHSERTKSLLVTQFKNAPRINGMVESFCTQIQDIQKSAEDCFDFRSLTYDEDRLAVGQQLDGIGEILNTPRYSNESDNEYRVRLRFKSFLIFNSGTPEQLMEILRFESQGTFVEYSDMFPGGYQLFTNGCHDFQDNEGLEETEWITHNYVSELMLRSSPAAIQFVPVTASYNVPIVFGFGPDSEPVPLYVNTDTDNNVPFYAEIPGPPDYQYYVNTGDVDNSFIEGGFADIQSSAVLGLDDGSILELDDGSYLMLYDEGGTYNTPGAGQISELLYYTE